MLGACKIIQNKIMKTLELRALENNVGGVDAGDIGCALSVIGFGLAFAGLVTATGGAGLLIAAGSYSIAPAAVGVSCFA